MCRTRLMESGIGLVESLRVAGPRSPRPREESYSPDFQVCLPYEGAFVWHVGRDEVVADPNRVLFVAGGEGFRLSQPVHGGYAELIITIQPCLLADMLGVSERQVPGHALFRRRSRPAAHSLQRLGVECLHRSSRDGWGGLAGEEWLVEFLRASFAAPPPTLEVSPSTTRLLRRAKEYLSANLSAPVRLAHVARAVGTSPAYLTTVFSRLEGVPLHRYLVQLRLARALVELPHTSDLTGWRASSAFQTTATSPPRSAGPSDARRRSFVSRCGAITPTSAPGARSSSGTRRPAKAFLTSSAEGVTKLAEVL